MSLSRKFFQVVGFLPLFLLIYVLPVQADDIEQFRPIGFSKDGKVFAFEVFSQGSSGKYEPRASVLFVDVLKNSYLKGVHWEGKVPNEEDLNVMGNHFDEVRKETNQRAKPFLDKWRIQEGFLGSPIFPAKYAVPLTDPSVWQSNAEEDIEYTYELILPPSHPKFGTNYVLDIKGIPTKKNCVQYEGLFERDCLKLSAAILKIEGEGAIPTTLQKDKSLPKVRSNAFDYKFLKAYVWKDQLVVFLEVYRGPGFEGADASIMVVTGALP